MLRQGQVSGEDRRQLRATLMQVADPGGGSGADRFGVGTSVAAAWQKPALSLAQEFCHVEFIHILAIHPKRIQLDAFCLITHLPIQIYGSFVVAHHC